VAAALEDAESGMPEERVRRACFTSQTLIRSAGACQGSLT
jgi:hypothetical protein